MCIRDRVEIVGPDGRKVEPGEQGEITAQGASRMLGYFRDPEATRAAIDADGFLHTGDLGYLAGDRKQSFLNAPSGQVHAVADDDLFDATGNV